MDNHPMAHLHSYWRMEYIEAPPPPSKEKNPFTSIPQATEDKSVHLIHRDTWSYIVLNKYPYNAGHLLVVPYRQVQELNKLTQEERINFFNTIIKAQDLLKKAINPSGFNIGFNLGSAGGAGIPQHLHCHVVPRWIGDTNFMPVLGSTQVLPQSLDAMYDRLINFVS